MSGSKTFALLIRAFGAQALARVSVPRSDLWDEAVSLPDGEQQGQR